MIFFFFNNILSIFNCTISLKLTILYFFKLKPFIIKESNFGKIGSKDYKNGRAAWKDVTKRLS